MFCLRVELWDSAQPGNKIYGKVVFKNDLVLIISQLSKNPILLIEVAMRFIYRMASKNVLTVQ